MHSNYSPTGSIIASCSLTVPSVDKLTMADPGRRSSFQSVWMDGRKDTAEGKSGGTEGEAFEFDAFLQERETASQLFHEKPQETRYPALTGLSTRSTNLGGNDGQNKEPATGDAGALEGWRNVPVVVPM